jgi:glycosyltransferase involved in cell wall biosynthesis
METMVQAAQCLQPGDNVSLTLIGSGQGKKEIIDLSESMPTPWLHILPGMSYSELVPRIMAADVCLGTFGSTSKAQRVIPCKIFECMYYNKPIIAGDTPAIRELLTHMENAYLVPCADPTALADALVRLAVDRPLRQKLASGARATFDQRCTHLAIGQELLEPLSRLAGKLSIPQIAGRIEPAVQQPLAPHFETLTPSGHVPESTAAVS